MKKLLALVLALTLLTTLALCGASAESKTAEAATAPAFMTPSVFVEYFYGFIFVVYDKP